MLLCVNFKLFLGKISGAATPSPWSLLTRGLYLFKFKISVYYFSNFKRILYYYLTFSTFHCDIIDIFYLVTSQQGFGVVCVALASQGVTLMTGLLEDVKVEGWTPPRPPEPARLDPLETYTATERLARLFSAVPLNQLLFYLATISYRKVCMMYGKNSIVFFAVKYHYRVLG